MYRLLVKSLFAFFAVAKINSHVCQLGLLLVHIFQWQCVGQKKGKENSDHRSTRHTVRTKTGLTRLGYVAVALFDNCTQS